MQFGLAFIDKTRSKAADIKREKCKYQTEADSTQSAITNVPCPTGGPAAGVALSVTDVGKPACAHGSTKLIAQVINGFGNSRVIFKAKILIPWP